MGNSFDYPIIGVLYGGQAASKGIDSLVVGAVGKQAGPVQAVQEGAWLYAGRMEFVALLPCMAGRFADMLGDGAAKVYVDDLHAFTDA